MPRKANIKKEVCRSSEVRRPNGPLIPKVDIQTKAIRNKNKGKGKKDQTDRQTARQTRPSSCIKLSFVLTEVFSQNDCHSRYSK